MTDRRSRVLAGGGDGGGKSSGGGDGGGGGGGKSSGGVGAAAASSHASSYFIFGSRLTLRRDRFLVRGFISTWACRSQPAGTDVRRITILGEYAPMSRVEIGVSERRKARPMTTTEITRDNLLLKGLVGRSP